MWYTRPQLGTSDAKGHSLPVKFVSNNYYIWPAIAVFAFLFAFLAVPASLQAAPSVQLGWTASTDTAVVGYTLYYGTASGVYTTTLDVGNSTTAYVAPLTPGTTYYFVVTAYDSFGIESGYSNEASFTAPGAQTPTVSLAGINTGATFNSSASIVLSATAAESNGQISQVAFYEGNNLVGSTTSSPYSVTWSNAAVGTHVLTAVAYDAAGAKANSTAISIQVVPFGISSSQLMATGAFRLTIAGAAGHLNQIYVSNDLQNWSLLTSATNTTGTLVIDDAAAGSYQKRFYKVVAN